VFVAAFMGDNNILRGKVTDIRDGQILLDATVGHLAMPIRDSSPSVGDELTVAVRANCVRLGRDPDRSGSNQLTATVAATEYLGDVIKVHMRAGEHSLMAKLPEQRYPELSGLAGQPVTASWDATDVQWLSD
jgi:ABC-type Fe3+/spermidine/putrescine transport system ATPase subunit